MKKTVLKKCTILIGKFRPATLLKRASNTDVFLQLLPY